MMLSVDQIEKIFEEFYKKGPNDNNLEILSNGMINYDGDIQVLKYPPIALPFYKITGTFFMEDIGVTNLALCPRECDMVWASGNHLTSLTGHPDRFSGSNRHIQFEYIEDLHLLSLFKIKNIDSVSFIPFFSDSVTVREDKLELSSILNRYLPLGPKGMPACMLAMKKAGYENNAKL
jgi:hypothetical protein